MNYIRDNSNHWTVISAGKNYSFDSTHPKYDELVGFIKASDEKSFIETLSVGKVVDTWSSGDFRLEGGFLFYLNEQIHPVITNRILEMIKEGFDHQPMLRFLENLYKNISYRAITELYGFLTHKALPITDDGHFLAYKSVRIHRGETIFDLEGREIKDGDLVDAFTRKSYRNNVGDQPTMNRNRVDDDCHKDCSYGLHAGALKYVTEQYIQDKIIIVKINPADVVSVPIYSETLKLRCSSYEVISVYDGPLPSTVYSNEQDREEEDDFFEEDDDNERYGDDCPDCGWDISECDCDEDDFEDDEEDESNWKENMAIPDGWEEFWPEGYYPNHFMIANSLSQTWEVGQCNNDRVNNPGDPQDHLYIRRKA